MFKKSMLALSLSIAMGSSYIANAQNIYPVQMPIDVQQEITKYSDIIVKLKNQLSEQENYNNILEEKLNNAKNLYKNIDPAYVTSQQIDNLNNIILTLSTTIEKNAINNLDLDKKINILEGFLENYKDKKIKEIENKQAVSDVKQDLIKSENIPQEEKKKEIVNIEKAIKEDAFRKEPEKIETVKVLKPSETISKPIENQIELETIAAPIKGEKSIENDDKDFLTTFGERIESFVIWFKELFGIQDSMNASEHVSKAEPSKIEIEMEKTKNTELDRIKSLDEKESSDKKNELENKQIEISETPLILEDKIMDKDNGVTGVNLNNENEDDKAKDVSDVNSELKDFLSENEDVDGVDALGKDNVPLNKDENEVQDFINQDKETVIIKNEVFLDKNDSVQENKESLIKKENEIIKDETSNSPTPEINDVKTKSSISEPIGNITFQSDESHDLSSPLLEPILYAVKKGDNLTKIVKNHFGVKSNQDIVNKVQEIASLNGIEAKDLIHIGDVLRIS